MTTIRLDVIAAATVPGEEADDAIPEAIEIDPPSAPPPGVVVIHVAPSPRLDPSRDLDKIEIVDDADGLAGFIRR